MIPTTHQVRELTDLVIDVTRPDKKDKQDLLNIRELLSYKFTPNLDDHKFYMWKLFTIFSKYSKNKATLKEFEKFGYKIYEN